MIFQRLNGGDAEKVFAIFYNVQGATITGGYCARLDTSTFDGVRITQPTTATLSLVMGIVNADIADSAYGKVQIYGYRQTAFVTNHGTTAIAAGDELLPVNAANHLARSAASTGISGFFVAGEAFATATTPAAAGKKVLIRAM